MAQVAILREPMLAVTHVTLAAPVKLLERPGCAVHDQSVVRHELCVTGRRTEVVTIRVKDAEYDDALVAQLGLAESATGNPVVVLDQQLANGIAIGQADEAVDVAAGQSGPPGKNTCDRTRHSLVHPSTA